MPQRPGRMMTADTSDRTSVRRLVVQEPGVKVRTLTDPRGALRARERARNEMVVCEAMKSLDVLVPTAVTDVAEGARLVFDDPQAVPLVDLGPFHGDLHAFYDVALGAAQTLRSVHQHGYLHRGLDPHLLLRQDSGTVLFSGMDRATRRTTDAVSVIDPVSLGLALAYIAPEQTGRMHRSVDERADLYALGVILYELLTGSLPLDADDALGWIHAHLARRPVAANAVHASIPAVLSDLLGRLLQKSPEDRYQSAAGLCADLERQAESLRLHGRVRSHELGVEDHGARFRIPETLFGRDGERRTLEQGLERACEGRAQMVLVSGHPGIGKSRLVAEMCRSLAERSGYLATGKADQYRRDIPFAMITQAFTELVMDVLTESSQRLRDWRSRLEDELDGLGSVMIEALPELRAVIGEQPAVPALPPRESRARLARAYQGFVRTFAGEHHPLILFVDDLQWIDAASLALLQEVLSSPDGIYLYVIGAYRDTEVHADHPLMAALDHLRETGLSIEDLPLGPLPLQPLRSLVQATVGAHPETGALADLVLEKTGSNPFFVGKFLDSLHADGLLTWSATQMRWTWDVEAIARADLTDNVVDLMANRVQRLSVETQRVLTYGAAIGSTFDVASAARVLRLSLAELGEALLPAVEQGFVTLIGGEFPLQSNDDRALNVAFTHDRIQEATYSLVSGHDRAALHRSIVSMLGESDDDSIFEAAHHWICADDGDLSADEDLLAVGAYLRAAERALAAGAFEPAQDYAQRGASKLGDQGWATHHDLCVALHVRLAEAAFINGRAELACEVGSTVLARAEHIMDKIRVHELRIYHQTSVTMHMADAVGEMLQVMALLGIDIAPAQSMEELGALVGRALGVFGDQSDAQILDRPAMTSAEHIAAQRVLASSLPAATMAAPMIHLPAVVTGMELAAEHGLSGHACTPLAHLAIVLCSSGHYNLGYRFGCLATGVAERFPEHQVTDNLIVFPIFVQHWIEPISNAAAGLEEAARRTFDLGHVGGFGYAINSAFVAKLQAGEDLRSLLELYPRWVASAAAAKQDIAVVSLSLWAQQMRCMVGEAPDSSVLGGALYESSVTLPFLIDNGVGPAILYDTLASCELAWRFADPERVLELCEARWQIVDTPGNGGMYSYVLLTTLKAMAQLATLHEQPDEAARVAVLEQVDAHRQRLTVWAEHCPANHGSRHALLEAERARVDGDNDTAGGLYDESIRLARLHAMPAEAATAAERAASFYRSSNRTIGARAYATEAVFSWEEMGATAVATHVRRTYDDVLTGERASGEELDVKALLRASEAMTGEPALDRLLKKLVDIVTTVAGAQRAVLAIERDGELLIEAHGGGDEISVMIGEPVDGWSDAPAEVLNYVHRTGRTLLLHDPVNEGRFTAAPYVRRAAPRSILAISLEHQGVRTGVVYLENNLTTHAFTSDRVRMLQALSSQAATAIENARLVGDLQARTQELARKNEQLTELDELRDEFLAKTSHELRTPLHGIMGLAQSMMEGTENASSLHDLSLIVASGRRLSNLVNDILDLSTLKKRELVVRERAMSLYDVASAVVGLAAPMALGKPVAVVNSVPEDCPTVMADSERVEQVLLNLVGNAIKFTSHGSVEVGVDAAVDGRVRIWVRDTGIGISNEAQGRIFSAFEQGSAGIVQDYGGAGLGLSVAQELVQLHGSELVVRSELGQGSTFSFELVVTEGVVADVVRPSLTHRAVQQVLHKSDKAPRANADTGRGFHVLVVDDEPVNLQVLDNYLGRQGYRVTTASGGAQALGLIDEGLSPDIVLLDVMMPGMDGFEVCRKLREDSDSGTLPVVMVTARSRSQDVVRGLQAGANDYVTKPFSSVEVAARIQTHVQLSNIHGAVGRFVPRSFLDLLGRDSIVDVRLGDSIEREMTVLYSDIRGFNGLSKGMTPTESFDFINAYLGLMEPVVSACGGFIDKYLGDGIMALFDRPSDAVKAGVMMHRTLDGFNTQRKASGQAPVRVGVGVHTGMLMLGTVGGELRMDTTVISDAVALAYRVEDTTKRFGTGLIITSSTFAELDERAFEIRWLDRMSLVDRQHKINIYDVFEAAEPHVRAARSASQATFEQAVDLFHNRQFEGAGELFSVVEAMDPNDRAVQVYLERCATISRQFTSI